MYFICVYELFNFNSFFLFIFSLVLLSNFTIKHGKTITGARLDGSLIRSYNILAKNVYLVKLCKTNVYLVRFL